MYFLKYETVLQKLQSKGILKLFEKFRDDARASSEKLLADNPEKSELIQQEEPILKLDSEVLSKIELKVGKENHLLVTYQNNNLVFYEIDQTNQIGYGAESQIWQGRNLKTGEFVAQKSGDYDSPAYAGWKIAQQKLNPHPNFVKSYAVGQICVPVGSNRDLRLEYIKPSFGETSAYLIMEQIQNAITMQDLNMRTRYWSAEEVNNFMQRLIDAYEVFDKEGIVGWDKMDVNILIDENNVPKLCDFNQISLNKVFYDTTVYYYFHAVGHLRSVYGYAIQLGESDYLEVYPSQIKSHIRELIDWVSNRNLNKRPLLMSRPLLNQKLREVIGLCEQRKCINYCLIREEDPSVVLQEKARVNEEECMVACNKALSLEAESFSEDVMNPDSYQAGSRRLLSYTEPEEEILTVQNSKKQNAEMESSQDKTGSTQSQANGDKPASAQTFFGIPMANAEVITESPTPLPFLFFKAKPVKHKRSRFNIRPLPLDNKEIQDLRMNFDPTAQGKCGSGKKTVISNAETGATVVKLQGNVSHSMESGKSLIFVGPNSRVKISGLKSCDQIHLPASEYHDGLPKCQNTSKGSILTSGSRNIVIETDTSCDSVMPGITPLSEDSQLDSINALMEFIKTPFFHSSLFCHGLAFVAAFREEIADKLLWQFAKGDEQRYNSWQKALTEFREKSSIKLVSDLSDMALRVVVAKDLQVTENTTHIAKDFMQALMSAKNEPRVYLGILARVFDEAALLLDKAIPYVSIGGLTQILTRTYDQYVASGSKAKAAHTLIDNLPLLIPGSRVLLDTLEDQERHLRKISNQPDDEIISTEGTEASCGLRRRVKHRT